MRTFAFVALALAIANAQFLGYDDVENISCKTDGKILKSAEATLSPNPALIGENVNIDITAVFSQDETVDSIKLHYIIDLATIEVSPAVQCKANTPCKLSLTYKVPTILGPGSYGMEAIPMRSGVKEGDATCKISLKSAATTFGDGPALSRCSGSPTICTLKSDDFKPYPIKKGGSDEVTVTFNCSQDLTEGTVDVEVFGSTLVTIKVSQACAANTDCTVTQTADVPSIPFVHSVHAKAIAKDKSGTELACYEGDVSLQLSPEEM